MDSSLVVILFGIALFMDSCWRYPFFFTNMMDTFISERELHTQRRLIFISSRSEGGLSPGEKNVIFFGVRYTFCVKSVSTTPRNGHYAMRRITIT
jgi:hypothetical protein